MLESVCRSYCSNSLYQYLGAYFWPDKLSVFNWISEYYPSATVITATTGALVAAGGLGVYWMKNREIEIKPLVSASTKVETNKSSNTLSLPRAVSAPEAVVANNPDSNNPIIKSDPIDVPKRHRHEPISNVLKMPPKQLAQVVANQEAVLNEVVFNNGIVYQAGEKFPVWPIVSAYISQNNKKVLRARANSSPSEKNRVIGEVLATLRLPADGIRPTDEAGIDNFNHQLTALNMAEHCIPQKNALRP